MEYKINDGIEIQEALWDEQTCVRRHGGFNIDKSALPAGTRYLPKGTPLALNNDGTAVVPVKTAKVYEAASSGATSLKVEKNSLFNVGDTIAGSAITAIDNSNDSYDTLTVDALAADLAINEVVSDGNEAAVVGLNYATAKIDSYPSCTITVQAYEIEEDSMPYPVNDAIKEALTVRHAWKI